MLHITIDIDFMLKFYYFDVPLLYCVKVSE